MFFSAVVCLKSRYLHVKAARRITRRYIHTSRQTRIDIFHLAENLTVVTRSVITSRSAVSMRRVHITLRKKSIADGFTWISKFESKVDRSNLRVRL